MSITQITKETRRQSYFEKLKTMPKSQKRCLEALYVCKGTANEIASLLAECRVLPYFNRNFVHPRLNELVGMGFVAVTGKAKCNVTGKVCAVYELTPEGREALKKWRE